VTSQMDIQSLIDDIDGILPHAASRLPWHKHGDAARSSQVLERVRSYLVSQQQNLVTSRQPQAATPLAPTDLIQQIRQAVSQEMDVLRDDLRQPWQAEMDALRQQRQSLVQEIQQLESTKQEMAALTQQKKAHEQFISEFSQELISRCTTNLTQKFGLILGELETRWASATTATKGSAIAPQERLEQLRHLQAQSDRLLTTLDANQRVIFETLQSNLQSYQESLSVGLEKMHNLGVQGEVLFTALINRLASGLGREASTLLQSSLEVSEATTKTNQLTAQPRQETQLSNDATTPQGAPFPLPRLQLGEQKSDRNSQLEATEATQNAATPQPSEFTALPQNKAPEPSSEDWEISEGLNSDHPGSEEDRRLDTFLQLDIETPNQSGSQDLDDLLELVNQSLTSSTPLLPHSELTPEDALNQAAQLNIISDRRRQEIDDLYKSLFGGDSLVNTVKPDELTPASSDSAATPPQETPMPSIEENRFAVAEPVNISSEVEELLFEGLTDPAIETTQGQAEDWSALPSSESWEGLFFTDAAPRSSVEAVAQASSSANGEHSVEQETITTIAALTDLFEEMGLSEEMPAVMPDSMPTTISQPLQATDNPEPEVNLVEDHYISALPEEDLLVTDEQMSDPDREICLDQNTLQQLSDDLESFEDAQRSSFRMQDGSDSTPDATPANLPSDRFLMSDELLAEDWEEFTFPSWPDDDLISPSLTETTSSDLSAQNPSPEADNRLSEELDFEPDLFPSEALELDQESVNSANRPSAQTLSEALIAFEDEIVIDEMEWDEPTDGIMEEAIASPEVEVVSKASTVNFDPETPVVFEAETVTQEQHPDSLNGTQETTAPPPAIPEASDFEAETATQEQQDRQINPTPALPQGLLAPGKDISSEDNPEAKQNLEPVSSNDVDLPQPETLDPQPEPEKKKNSDSDANS